MNLYSAATAATICTSAMLVSACGVSEEPPLKMPTVSSTIMTTPEVTTITPTRAISHEPLNLQNPRPPEERFVNHYTNQGTIGASCIVVVAMTTVDGLPNYEAVVFGGPDHDERVYESYSVPAEIINRLSEAPAIKKICN